MKNYRRRDGSIMWSDWAWDLWGCCLVVVLLSPLLILVLGIMAWAIAQVGALM